MKAIQKKDNLTLRKTVSIAAWALIKNITVHPLLNAVALATSIFLSLFSLIYASVQGNLINIFVDNTGNFLPIYIAAGLLIGTQLIRDLISFLGNMYTGSILEAKRSMFFNREYLNHLKSLDIGRIDNSEFQDLKDKALDRGDWKTQQMSGYCYSLIAGSIALIVSGGLILSLTPLAALIVFIGSVPSFVVEYYYTRDYRRRWDDLTVERRSSRSRWYAFEKKNILQELLVNNSAEKFLNGVFSYINNEYGKTIGVENKYATPNILVRVFEQLCIGLALFIILFNGLNGTLSVGDVLFALGILYTINSALVEIVSNIGNINNNIPYVKIYKDFMETTPLVAQEAHALSIPDTHVTVSFNNVSFAYPGSASPTLKNISFTIASGEKIALVGLNGAGKTTLLRLLLRMYDVTEGSITVNGIDIRQLNLTQWYEKLSLMFQDCQDYEYLSLREASTLFVKNIVSDERILETFKQVMGEDIASTSADLDVMQTPQYGGKELSGGQFQKVALVRTLLKDAPLIILDEPTSAIDALSEEHIFNGLHNLAKDRTLLFVSHRFTTIRNADRIIVLNNGTVDADGTHEELMKSHGLYEKMYKTQVLGEKS